MSITNTVSRESVLSIMVTVIRTEIADPSENLGWNSISFGANSLVNPSIFLRVMGNR